MEWRTRPRPTEPNPVVWEVVAQDGNRIELRAKFQSVNGEERNSATVLRITQGVGIELFSCPRESGGNKKYPSFKHLGIETVLTPGGVLVPRIVDNYSIVPAAKFATQS